MVMVRHPGRFAYDPACGGGSGAPGPKQDMSSTPPGGRLNLLLSSTDWRQESWADHLPRLLEPMGVHAVRVRSGREAGETLRTTRIDIAVVDLSLPLDEQVANDEPAPNPEGGMRLLELLFRSTAPPPTLVVKRRRAERDDAREIAHALRAGAFAVIERPVRMELLLQTMQRVLARHYRDRWPSTRGNS